MSGRLTTRVPDLERDLVDDLSVTVVCYNTRSRAPAMLDTSRGVATGNEVQMLPDDTTPTKTCSRCGAVLPATTEYFSQECGRLRGQCRRCRSELQRPSNALYMRRRRAAGLVDPEDSRRWSRESYRRNIEKRREYDKQRRADPERQDAQRDALRRWRQRHPGAKRAESRADYLANKESIKARHAAWKAEHPERVAAHGRKRRSLLKGATGAHTGADVIAQRARQKGRCYWCHEKVGRHYHVDHVVPLSKGGSNGPENIVISCPTCNQRKNAKHPMDFAGVML